MRHSVPWSHQTELAAERVSASAARGFVRLHLGEHDLPHLLDDVRLVVSELAANALQHARTPFVVTLEGDGGSVLLTVQDGSSVVPVRATATDTEASGRGLWIVDELCHDWGVVLHGDGEAKSVWALFMTRVDPGRVSSSATARHSATAHLPRSGGDVLL